MRETSLLPSARSWKWRGVLLVSRLISWIGAPLHSLHWKILLLHLAVLGLPGVWFALHERAHWREAAVPGLIGFAAAMVLAYALSAYLTRIIRDLAQRASRIAEGEEGVPLETWTKSEIGELARALERMRQRLEGKAYVEEMTLNFSHELKTPLASIRGAAELLEGGALLNNADRMRFLGNIQAEVQRLDHIVNDLLTLARLETHPFHQERTDLAAVLRALAPTYSERASSLGLLLLLHVPEGPLLIQWPEEAARLLATNLLDNAMRFTPEGGHIQLTLSHAGLEIFDSGIGIEAEFLPRIFDRFFTTENPRTGERGSGLGLAMVKAIVGRHQGAIEVQSAPKHGTRFFVRLPAIS